MSYRDFRFPAVFDQLGLRFAEADLTSMVSPADLSPELLRTIAQGADLSLGISSEKARSEFIVAPMLLAARNLTDGGFGIMSGIEFNVDAALGLTGVCDFLLQRPATNYFVAAPIAVVVEVKNDTVRDAYAQCIAGMRACQIFNQRKGNDTPIHGAATTGSEWKFMKLVGDSLSLDQHFYFLDKPGKIIAVIKHMVESVPPASVAA